ncbi:FxsA family protein [Patulibacter defluvii]|uniref:FxsA family protein n=1 Tax=Patulibacter defluvii TaxID=3095358 RepID=UPI002A75784A|nr:FxsA family protein [Patulibacter sp. DM4]
MPLLFLVLLVGGFAFEIWLALLVADQIGAAPTVLLLLGGSLLGSRLIARAGLRTWQRVGEAARSGRSPGAEALDGALLLAGGALLLVPGFASGVLGLVLLLPPVRAGARRFVLPLAARRVAAPFVVVGGFRRGRPAGGGPADVEGTATEEPTLAPEARRLPPDLEGRAEERRDG